jgi:hypothetical protein
MNTNTIILLLLLSIVLIIFLYKYLNKKSKVNSNIDFNKENFSNEKVDDYNLESKIKSNNLNTPLKGLNLEFKENRAFAKELLYNKKFDDLRKVKPLNLLTEDILFKDIVPYENQIDGRLGLDMCLEKCNGTCVEYGVTGNAYCFPDENKEIIKSTFYETLRDKTYQTENVDEKPQKMQFPTMR